MSDLRWCVCVTNFERILYIFACIYQILTKSIQRNQKFAQRKEVKKKNKNKFKAARRENKSNQSPKAKHFQSHDSVARRVIVCFVIVALWRVFWQKNSATGEHDDASTILKLLKYKWKQFSKVLDSNHSFRNYFKWWGNGLSRETHRIQLNWAWRQILYLSVA